MTVTPSRYEREAAQGRRAAVRGNEAVELQDELDAEQAYADWAVVQIAEMIRVAERLVSTAGDKATAGGLKHISEVRVRELRSAEIEPIFGRLDMTDDETLYVAKAHIDGDDIMRPVAIDWRAPMGELFFQASRTYPSGVGRRRTIKMRHQTVEALSDETLTKGFRVKPAVPEVVAPPVDVEVDVPDGDLVRADLPSAAPVEGVIANEPVPLATAPPQDAVEDHAEGEDDFRAADILLAELDADRTDRMHEIVATIQADQDRLIRADASQPLLVQGSPGTGKTIVGLHRAAYVLYRQLQEKGVPSVLVLGPNERFISYVADVLPSLGESTAAQMSVAQLMLTGLPVNDRKGVVVRAADTPAAALLKGDIRMEATVVRAVWALTTPEPVELGHRRFVLRLRKEQVAEIFRALASSRIPYRDARNELLPRLADAFYAELTERRSVGESFGPGERDEIMGALRRQMAKDGQLDRIMPKLEPKAVLNRLLDDPERLVSASDGWLKPRHIEVLARAKGRGTQWTRADLALLDLVAEIITEPPVVFGHVVVDEAQDLSPMEWRRISRRIQARSITILGDVAQKTSVWPGTTWTELLAPLGYDDLEELALTVGYRVPAEVLEYADQILPWTAPHQPPTRSFRSTEAPVVMKASRGALTKRVDEQLGIRRSGTLALIVATSDLAAWQRKVKETRRRKVHVIDPAEAKGLEFDHVIVVEPAAIAAAKPDGLQQLYVALTRPTHTLTVVHERVLPPALRGEQPAARKRKAEPEPAAATASEPVVAPPPAPAPEPTGTRPRRVLVAERSGASNGDPPSTNGHHVPSTSDASKAAESPIAPPAEAHLVGTPQSDGAPADEPGSIRSFVRRLVRRKT